MCGRTSLFPARSDLEDRFDAEVAPDVAYRPRYNIAPGASIEVITNESEGTIRHGRWGFRPPWADGDDEGFINARSETAAEKPAFRAAWADRPCLVLSSGFYEWQPRERGPKRAYRVYRPTDVAFAMAGLWSGDGKTASGTSVTILTTEPNEVCARIHDRMPVVLPPGSERAWLTGTPRDRRDLCVPYPADDLEAYPISSRVNDPANDDPRVIEPVGDDQASLGEFG